MNSIDFSSLQEALSIANETEFGLAAGVFSNDLRKVTSFCSRLTAGNVYVNTFNNVCTSSSFFSVTNRLLDCSAVGPIRRLQSIGIRSRERSCGNRELLANQERVRECQRSSRGSLPARYQ